MAAPLYYTAPELYYFLNGFTDSINLYATCRGKVLKEVEVSVWMYEAC